MCFSVYYNISADASKDVKVVRLTADFPMFDFSSKQCRGGGPPLRCWVLSEISERDTPLLCIAIAPGRKL